MEVWKFVVIRSKHILILNLCFLFLILLPICKFNSSIVRYISNRILSYARGWSYWWTSDKRLLVWHRIASHKEKVEFWPQLVSHFPILPLSLLRDNLFKIKSCCGYVQHIHFLANSFFSFFKHVSISFTCVSYYIYILGMFCIVDGILKPLVHWNLEKVLWRMTLRRKRKKMRRMNLILN